MRGRGLLTKTNGDVCLDLASIGRTRVHTCKAPSTVATPTYALHTQPPVYQRPNTVMRMIAACRYPLRTYNE